MTNQAFLTIADWCDKVGVSKNLFYRLAPEDRPATIRLGRRVLISPDAYTEWCKRLELKSK